MSDDDSGLDVRTRFAHRVALGASVSTAAHDLGIGRSTAYRWLSDPAVTREIQIIRTGVREHIIGTWVAAAADSIESARLGELVLRQIAVHGRSENARVQAAAKLYDIRETMLTRVLELAPIGSTTAATDDVDLGEYVRQALIPVADLDPRLVVAPDDLSGLDEL